MKKIILTLFSVFVAAAFSLNAQTTLTGSTGAIPDNACPTLTSFTASMSESGLVGADWEISNVTIDISHTWDGDLSINLVSPSGTTLVLSEFNGSFADNYTNTVFVDGATPITSGSAPFTGEFAPEGGTFADTFSGDEVNGTWSLAICDDAGGDVGTVNSWSITFYNGTTTSNGSVGAIPDNACPALTNFTATTANAGNLGSEWVIDNVTLDISHTWDGDLSLNLVSPSGTTLNLSQFNGSLNDNYTNTVFVDGGAPITSGSAPFTGEFEPQGGTFAATFGGEVVAGDWLLAVCDDAGGDVGTVNSWSITFAELTGEPPVIQCPADIVVSNDAGQCGAIVNFGDAVAIDPDGDLDTVVQISGLPTGSEFPVGVNVVEFRATDLAGNSSECSFTITVEDVDDPVIECLSEYTVELGTTGTYTLDPEELLASFSDNCGIVSYTIGGALIPEARSLATVFAGGNGGAPGGAVFFNVTAIEDITVTGFLTHLQGGGGIPFSMDIYTIVGGTYQGNEQNAAAWTLLGTASGDAQPDGTPSEAFLSSGVNLTGGTDYAMAIVLDANNAHRYTNGNGSNQNFANDDLSMSLGAGQNTPFGSGTFSPRVWNGAINYEALISGGPQDALLECSDIGQVGISVTAVDAAGNSVTCNTLVTVQDTTAPIILCDGEPIVGDFLEEFEGSSAPAGWTTEVLVGAADWEFGSGDMPTGPDFPTNAAIFDDDAAGNGNVNASRLISPVYNLTGVAIADLSFDYANQEFLGDGTLQVEVFDGSAWQEVLFVEDDLADIQTANIDVLPYANANFQVRFNYDDEGGWSWGAGVDNFSLTYSAPSTTVQVVLDSNGLANYDASDLLLSVEEGCDYTVTVDVPGEVSGDLTTLFAGGNGGSPGGAIYFDVTAVEDVSLTALDMHTGETGAFTVEVYAIPDGTYIGNENNAGAWTLIATGSGDAQGAGTPSLATLDAAVSLTAGTTYGMALVLDADHGHDYTNGDGTNQNYATPELAFAGGSATNTPFSGTVFNPRVFNGRFYYDYIGVTAAENFDFDCSYLGVNNIEVTVTDNSGNVATCISAVEVIDVDDPILVCQDATVSLDENGMAEVLPEYFIDPVESFDNCGITITAVDVTDVTCADIGTPITVTVFVSDDSGNIASCQATMTVVDDMGPMLENCPEDMTVDPGAVDLFYEVPDYTADIVATDNCSDPVGAVTQDPPAGTLLADGVYTVTLSATDDEGNVGTCSFELTVESVLGVTSNQLNAGVAIYPNPARNVMNIGNSTDIQLERAVIYDLNGRMIQSIDLSDMSAEASVNVAHLASGVYMVQLQAQDGQAIKRLVKE
jgi:subtilisin-like proprotein convertase family protein